MPIYAYEALVPGCPHCAEGFEVLQDLDEPPLAACPQCGREVHRVIGEVAMKVRVASDPESAARKGFTTYRRVGKGQYEKVAGEGAEGIVDKRTPAKKRKPIDLG